MLLGFRLQQVTEDKKRERIRKQEVRGPSPIPAQQKNECFECPFLLPAHSGGIGRKRTLPRFLSHALPSRCHQRNRSFNDLPRNNDADRQIRVVLFFFRDCAANLTAPDPAAQVLSRSQKKRQTAHSSGTRSAKRRAESEAAAETVGAADGRFLVHTHSPPRAPSPKKKTATVPGPSSGRRLSAESQMRILPISFGNRASTARGDLRVLKAVGVQMKHLSCIPPADCVPSSSCPRAARRPSCRALVVGAMILPRCPSA